MAKRPRTPNLPPVNIDESRVPPYELPELLRGTDGMAVATPEVWWRRRRPEILRLFAEHVYGRTPDALPATRYEVRHRDPEALGGRATRAEVR